MAGLRADLVVLGRVATLGGDAGFGWQEGVAISDGRVVATGDHASIEALPGAGARVWQLPSSVVVVPGLTDAHLHLTSAALAAAELDLSKAPDRPQIEDAIGARHEAMVAAGDERGWLLGHGWSLDRMGEWPTAADLDRLAPGRPVALWAHDHHSRWASSEALRAAGVTDLTPDPPGGMVRRDRDGHATGILHEHAAKLLAPGIPRPTREAVASALWDYGHRLAALGVVAAHDPGEMEDEPALERGPILYGELARAGRLPIRVLGSIRPEQVPRAIELGLRSGVGPEPLDQSDSTSVRVADHARTGWLKLFADGALGSRSAALLDDYEPTDSMSPVGGPRGMLLAPEEVLRQRAAAAVAAGIAVQIHGIGDQAVRTALDVLASLPIAPGGFRYRVEHAQLVSPADRPRFAALGIAASVQPCHLASDAAAVRQAWGPRSADAFPFGDIAQSGAVMPFGTDAPVESPDPWPGVAIAVTRIGARWSDRRSFHPEQSVDLARALRAACLDGPMSAGEPDRGRLVHGHRADLVVVPAEALDEPVGPGGALESARPLATLIDGVEVWRAPSFDA
jgi:predicted amidohydrolase YtcJ